jgi:NAD(P)-dependent dehydrogenase (short-subunit alcohol dehydrogenase family)
VLARGDEAPARRRGDHQHLIDQRPARERVADRLLATKGAINALTYALAQALDEKGIRVNCVAPGPVWTPLIPATMDEEKVETFGQQTPMGRAAQPDEIAPSYVFFASGQLSSYYSGEILAPIGGETLPG